MLVFETGLSSQFRYDLASKEIPETKSFDQWVRLLCEYDEDLRARRTGFRQNNWGPNWGSRSQAHHSASRGPTRDPDAMDIDRLSTEEMMRRGLCFQCGEHGHLARECPQRSKRPSGRSKVASQTAASSSTAPPAASAPAAAPKRPTATLEEVRDKTPTVNAARTPTIDEIAKAVAAALKSQGF